MSAITTDSRSSRRPIWIQEEGLAATLLYIGSDIKIIEDLKEMVFGDSRKYYLTFYLQEYMDPMADIPTVTSTRQSIQFRRIVPDLSDAYSNNGSENRSVSTRVSSAGTWTLRRICEATTASWHRMTRVDTTSYKSKYE